MAEDVAALADRVFTSVLAPLVLGGAMTPAKPIGSRAALALAACDVRPTDADLASRADLARVAQARKIVPVDRVDDPTGAEWAMGAALHDLLQAASPAWVRRAGPRRLLDLTAATLERVAPVTSAREALSRHTWFSRVMEIARKDTSVSWWVGSREFRGEEPPRRLLMWQDVRRVHVATSARGLTELLGNGGVPEHAILFQEVLTRLLRATPLTDVATCGRAAPVFAWSAESLALVANPTAQTLALRAAALTDSDAVDAALGRATRALVTAKAWRELSTALAFLGQRALAGALGPGAWPGMTDGAEDLAFARAAGALYAKRTVDDARSPLSEGERRRLALVLEGASRASAASEMGLVARALAGKGSISAGSS